MLYTSWAEQVHGQALPSAETGIPGPVAPATGARPRNNGFPEAPQPGTLAQATGQIPPSEDGASLSGVVLDPSGAAVVGAHVTLSKADGSQQRSAKSSTDGSFSFAKLPEGSYLVYVRATGLSDFTSDRLVLAPQQSYKLPEVMMRIPVTKTAVTVQPTEQIAAEQLKMEERQRVFGIFPNYFTSFIPDPAPLTAKQKFSLTSHDTFDPVSLIGVGIAAGIQQATNSFAGYGQGAAGYGKRYAAAFGDSLTDEFLSHAVFPSLLHQDPRYFYQGYGSKKSRLLHAISFAVLTRSDTGGVTLNYSYLLGDLGSGAAVLPVSEPKVVRKSDLGRAPKSRFTGLRCNLETRSSDYRFGGDSVWRFAPI